ncbi:MAG: hypothetical protein KGJ79_05205 [Alphaproteobacteria bacterium]|nr:hypothetical protein [Alphaproteobacteria bacterium]MDE2110518.1 hypothetical protein [Alphaproteobacteria bacterium]
MPLNSSEFERALTLIEKLYRALADADTGAGDINRGLIQEAVVFLEQNGRGVPQFAG